MKYSQFAAVAVRLVERIPTVVWAAWILAIVITTGVMALQGGPTN